MFFWLIIDFMFDNILCSIPNNIHKNVGFVPLTCFISVESVKTIKHLIYSKSNH